MYYKPKNILPILKSFLYIVVNAHWLNSSLQSDCRSWSAVLQTEQAVCELGCSSAAVNSSCDVSTFFSSKSLAVSDNILELWIIPSSFREDDKVHLWEEKC